jgi:hypothetical protein
MRAVLSLGALAALAATGLVGQRLTVAPELRVVSAPAEAIAAGDGVLLGALESGRPARLVRVRPLTLEPASPPLRLREDVVTDFALSPGGGQVAVGSDQRSRIEFVDLRHWRTLGAMTLPGPRPAGYGGASGLVWVAPRRVVVLSGADYMRAEPIVIDPIARRVVHRSRWRGPPLQSATGGGLLVVLAAPSQGPKPGAARLVAYDARGRLRELRLERIMAGSGDRGPGPARDLTPGLAVDRAGRHAYVVAAEGSLVAEVDLRAWRVSYHEPSEPVTAWRRLRDLVEPPAHAKGPPVDAAWREAKVLPNGAIAVTGDNWPPVERRHAPLAYPFGVRLIDPRTWTVRTLDEESEDFTLAGGILLARRWSLEDDPLEGIGVRAYDTAGKLRFAQFTGADTIVRGAAGRHAYVEVKRDDRRTIHVVDLETGQTERVLRWREIRVLSP